MSSTGAVPPIASTDHASAFHAVPPRDVTKATAVFQQVQQAQQKEGSQSLQFTANANYFFNPRDPNPSTVQTLPEPTHPSTVQTLPESPTNLARSTDSLDSPLMGPDGRSIIGIGRLGIGMRPLPTALPSLRIVTNDQLYATKQQAFEALSALSLPEMNEKAKYELIFAALYNTSTVGEEKKRQVTQLLVKAGWKWQNAYLAIFNIYTTSTELPKWLTPPPPPAPPPEPPPPIQPQRVRAFKQPGLCSDVKGIWVKLGDAFS